MKELKIIKQRENSLFNRKEIEVSVESDVAPKIQEAEVFIAKEFSSHHEHIKIMKIKGRFGSKSFIITASIYHTKEDKEKIEPKSKKEKKAASDKKEADAKESKAEEKEE
jgi:ribosomal protein S24E